MRDLNGKITGGTLSADEWNDVPSELQNVIEDQGIVLSGADLNQLGKAIAGYVANGTFYTDSGVVNAYVLSVIGLRQNAPTLTDGFAVDFVPGADNTGASTVNVGGFGVKAIKRPDGADVVAGDIADIASLKFSVSNDWFVLIGFSPISSTTNKGIIETATDGESIAGTDTTRASTPAGVKAFHDANTTTVPDASTTVKGIVELATDSETVTGTDAIRAVTPFGLTAAIDAIAQPVTGSNANGSFRTEVDGQIQQWGIKVSGTAVTFPIAFPSAVESIVLVDFDAGDTGGLSQNSVIGAYTTTGFTISRAASANEVHWMANGN